jgi:exodeoxyribonuclease VII large subunit
MRQGRSGRSSASSAANSNAYGNFDLFVDPSVAALIPGATPESAVSIAALTSTAREIVEGALAPLWVRGDVSDFKRHRNGHWYFCLRDVDAQVRCVVWARDQRQIPAPPDDGMEVLAYGQLTVYPARGDLHLTVKRMEARGDGLWRKALEETRARLERDGLLVSERKRPLPFVPQCVAVVTSPDGAAIRDVVAVVQRRAPYVRLVLSPTKVQGDGAPEEICAAIERVCRWGGADVMIVGRGGGAREDLWAFNDERVARAIAASPIPVISAVGHEIDTTIADLVADYRAPTPSAAGEAVVPVREDMIAALDVHRRALTSVMQRSIGDARTTLQYEARMLKTAALRTFENQRAAVKTLSGRLNALSPLATLARGYTVARDPESGRTLSSVSAFVPETIFTLTVRDGVVAARTVLTEERTRTAAVGAPSRVQVQADDTDAPPAEASRVESEDDRR